MAVSGKVSGIYRKDGASVAFTDLLLEDTGDHKVFRVPVADTTHRYWDKLQPLTVEVDPGTGFQAPTVEYEVQHPSGYVVFKDALTATTHVQVSGYAFALAQVAGAFGWSLDLKVDALDATTFENNGWRDYVTAFREFTAKVEKFWINETEFNLFNTELLFAFYVSTLSDKSRFEGWGTIESESVTVSTTELIKAPLDIRGTDGIFYRRDD